MCDAKIRPFPDPTELVCDGGTHDGAHTATLRDMAYPGSATVINWFDDDRRTYRGEWAPCPAPCVLPANHRGAHDDH